ncbi:CheR family methyltransferase [Caulobacter sp.]|uniref:CheR family methyltransferase n=1 Tax=Caulobacter sp. TaxID=78 RepID=UPI0017FE25F5
MSQAAMAVQSSAQMGPALGEPLSLRNFGRLAEFIHAYSGIKMPAGKHTMLEGRLRRRMRANGYSQVNDYCRFLFDEGGLESESVHLIDAVTTNKTDFFREPIHFDHLRNTVLPKLAASGRGRIKVWSAACSTGAEPYTLAMVMDEFCGQGRNLDYSILATDICTEVLKQAVAGRFPEPMIEPISQERRRRYVLAARDPRAREVRIAPALRSKVSFARLNLMDATYPVDRDMDVVFCRNILIYFDKPTQAKVLSSLCDHLRPGGFLFLGHSESAAGVDLPVRQVANTVFQKVAV